MRCYKFWIKREHSSPFELLEFQANDSIAALNALPPCVYWNHVVRGDWERSDP